MPCSSPRQQGMCWCGVFAVAKREGAGWMWWFLQGWVLLSWAPHPAVGHTRVLLTSPGTACCSLRAGWSQSFRNALPTLWLVLAHSSDREVAGADAPTLWGTQTCKTSSPHEGHPLQAPQSWQDHHQGWKTALGLQLLLWPEGGWRAPVVREGELLTQQLLCSAKLCPTLLLLYSLF